MDSYYGEMGATCLSVKPDAIKQRNFFNIRLVSEIDKEIVGMALLFGSNSGLESYNKNIKYFWHAFAFNPLRSLLFHLSLKQQLYLYLQYRKLLEKVSLSTGKVTVLSGISTWGIVSNDDSFRDLILSYELKAAPVRVHDACGLKLYYDEEQFADALVIIDPGKPETFRAEKDLEKIEL